MKKLTLVLLAICSLVCVAEARPRGDHGGRRPHRPQQHHRPAPPPKHHHRPAHRDNFFWGLNFGTWGGSLSVGTRIGRHGGISYTIPLYDNTPSYTKETVIVREPTIVQQPIIVQSPVQSTTSQSSSGNRTWVEGHWVEKRDNNGYLVSRTWVEGHWE